MLLFTGSTTVSPTLNYVDLTVITNTECAAIFGSIITPTKICTSTPGGQSPCNVSFSFRYSSENLLTVRNTKIAATTQTAPTVTNFHCSISAVQSVLYPLLAYDSDQNLSAMRYSFFFFKNIFL